MKLPPLSRPARRCLTLTLSFVLAGCDAFVPQEPGSFYTPPDPLPDGPPGMLIRSEPMEEDLPPGARAWRILYRSTDLHGDPVAVSGFVVAPEAATSAPQPVLAWAHGTVGVLPRCGVSHTDEPYQQTPAVEEMVGRGFVVVATDYPGLSTPGVHPYLVGPSEAHAVLDGVRAVAGLLPSAGPRFAVWGASQGGHAALWTAQSARAYAPELDLVAAAASAPATDLASILRAGSARKGTGVFLAQLLYAWDRVFPLTELDALIRPEERECFDEMATTCFTTLPAFLLVGGVVTPGEYLAADPTTTPPWDGLLAQNRPQGRIDVPLLLTQGTEDEVVPFEMTEREAEVRCSRGETVEFVGLEGVGHDAREESAALTLEWLEARFEGLPTESTCPDPEGG